LLRRAGSEANWPRPEYLARNTSSFRDSGSRSNLLIKDAAFARFLWRIRIWPREIAGDRLHCGAGAEIEEGAVEAKRTD